MATLDELCNKNKEHVKIFQQLYTQEMENEQVLQELNLCKDDQTIYKSAGPIIIKQDKSEAVLTVEKRLEYIRGQKDAVKSEVDDTNTKIKQLMEKTQVAK